MYSHGLSPRNFVELVEAVLIGSTFVSNFKILAKFVSEKSFTENIDMKMENKKK